MDVFEIISFCYLVIALLTLVPTIKNHVTGVKLNPGGASFGSSTHFSDENKKRLSDHYSRLQGTLGFWKKKAQLYTSFHYYCVIWTILSAWAVPIVAALSPEISQESAPQLKASDCSCIRSCSFGPKFS